MDNWAHLPRAPGLPADRVPAPPISPPVEPRADVPSLDRLPPEWFELLCADIARVIDGGDVRLYGRRGQRQDGIDLYGRAADGTMVAYQAKRSSSFSGRDARTALSRFFEGSLPFSVDRFVLVGTFDDRERGIIDAFEQARIEHPEVELDVWGVYKITAVLRRDRRLTERALGPGWADHLCGVSVAPSGNPGAALREYLMSVERRWSGLPLWLRHRGRPTATTVAELHQRARVISAPDLGRLRRTTSVSVDSVDVLDPTKYHSWRSDVTRVERGSDLTMPLEDAYGAARHVVLMGDPGMGKSWALAAQVCVAARRALNDALEPIPVAMRAADVAGFGERDLLRQAVDAAIDAVDHELAADVMDELANGVLAAVAEGRALYFLIDALDEVPVKQRPATVVKIAALTELHRAVVTTRSSGFGGTAGLADPDRIELEIVPLAPQQSMAYIDAWFGTNAGAGDAVRASVLRPQFSQLARVPLLLAFLCLLADADDPLPERPVDLFRGMIRRLLGRPWRERPDASDDKGTLDLHNPIVDQRISIASYVAYDLATTQRGWVDSVARDELSTIIARACTSGACDWTTAIPDVGGRLARAHQEIDALAELLVSRRGAGRDDLEVGFLHRTLQEFLVAHFVGAFGDPQYLDPLTRHSEVGLLDPSWSQVLTLMAGTAKDGVGLPAQIRSISNDPLGIATLRALQACANVAGRHPDIVDAAIELLRMPTRPYSVQRHLIEALSATGEFDVLVAIAKDRYIRSQLRQLAVWGLGSQRDDQSGAVLYGLLEDPDMWIRGTAAYELGVAGDVSCAISALRDLANIGEPSMQKAALEAIVALAPDEGSRLLRQLSDRDAEVDEAVLEGALGTLAAAGVEIAAVTCADIVRDERADVLIRAAALEALANLDAALTLEVVATVHRASSPILRRAALGALVRVPEGTVTGAGLTRLLRGGDVSDVRDDDPEVLVDLLTDDTIDPVWRAEAIGALRDEVGDSALELLIVRGRAPGVVRAKAAARLWERGLRDVAINAFVALTSDPDPYVRRLATRGLGEAGGENALNVLMQMLHDDGTWVAQEAAGALKRSGHAAAAVDVILSNPTFRRGRLIQLLKILGGERSVAALLREAGRDLDLDGVSALDALAALAECEHAPALIALAETVKGDAFQLQHVGAALRGIIQRHPTCLLTHPGLLDSLDSQDRNDVALLVLASRWGEGVEWLATVDLDSHGRWSRYDERLDK